MRYIGSTTGLPKILFENQIEQFFLKYGSKVLKLGSKASL